MSWRDSAVVWASGALLTLAPAAAALCPQPGEPAVLVAMDGQAMHAALALGAEPLGRTADQRFFVVAAPTAEALLRLQLGGPWLILRTPARFGCASTKAQGAELA